MAEGRWCACWRLAPAAWLAVVATAAMLGVGGCTDQTKIHEAEMTQLLAVLPGRYDNRTQVELDLRSGAHRVHDGILLVIIHTYTPRLGHHVYYAQEMPASDPQRLLSQKMFSFEVDDKKGIVETVYEFAEPQRWRDGLQNKDLFTVVMMEDVHPEGCRLFWKKTADGFAASHDPTVCPDVVPGSPPLVSFEAGVLTIGDYQFRRSR